MLSIPIHIIGTRRLGLFTPFLAYVIAILLLCQIVIALFLKESALRNLSLSQAAFSADPTTQVVNQASRVHRRSVVTLSSSERKNESTGRSDSAQIRTRNQNSVRWIDDGLDPDRDVFFPWPGDLECLNFSIHFAKKYTFKPRALVSFPGSGNSWFRYLIDSSTGIFTGSIFNDQKLFKAGLRGEMTRPNDGSTIVQKTHHDAISNIDLALMGPSLSNRRKLQAFVKVSELVFGYRGVLLIRNPYEALLSYWNFMKTKDHKGHANAADFSTSQWRKFVEIGSQKWANLIESWLENSMDLHVVQYENLRKDPEGELMRLLDYLNQPIDLYRLRCVMKHLEGPFHRDADFETTNSTNAERFSSDNTRHASSPLDLIVQQHIDDMNKLFNHKNILVRLNYTLPENISSYYT